MSSTDIEANNKQNATEPREEVIKTAIKFLQNPHVSKSPLSKSQQFLRSKGLTDQEIQIACERSGAYGVHFFNEKPPNLPPSLSMQQMCVPPAPQSMFLRIRDHLQSVALFSGLIYIIYIFYKRFIKRLLFGEEKKKTVEDSISDLSKAMTESINDLRENLTEVRSQVDKIRNLNGDGSTTHLQLQDLKTEVSSVKGLLLNRKQFPRVSNNPVVPPSIPAWQLSSVQPGDTHDDGKAEEMMEIGSGSGSSETEVVTKNSDSSLEIM